MNPQSVEKLGKGVMPYDPSWNSSVQERKQFALGRWSQGNQDKCPYVQITRDEELRDLTKDWSIR